MRKFMIAAAATVLAGAYLPAALAADPAPQFTTTVFVNKGSAGSVTRALNALHAKMEAQGWVYSDMEVYTEDGDLEGIFVTYVRTPAAPAVPAVPATPAPEAAPAG